MVNRFGFALACVMLTVAMCTASVQAEVRSANVQYTHNGTVLQGYLVYDDALVGRRPGVLVIHEWWGCNDYVKGRATQLARLGYVAFALDMYGKGSVTTDPKQASTWAALYKGTDLGRQRAAAGLNILKNHELVDPTRIAAVGYCFGGSMVQELAYSGADIAGIVSFHGGLMAPKPADDNRIKARMLICHGAADVFISAQERLDFQNGVDRAGVDWQMISYSGAVHAFTNPDADKVGIKGVAYNRAADRRSWQHMQLFFHEIFAAE